MLGELASVTPGLLASVGQGDKVAVKKADDDDEDDEEEPAQGRLLDSCMELLSVFGDQSVKGVRDAVKKVCDRLTGKIAGAVSGVCMRSHQHIDIFDIVS